jgi:hypothetical protein
MFSLYQREEVTVSKVQVVLRLKATFDLVQKEQSVWQIYTRNGRFLGTATSPSGFDLAVVFASLGLPVEEVISRCEVADDAQTKLPGVIDRVLLPAQRAL